MCPARSLRFGALAAPIAIVALSLLANANEVLGTIGIEALQWIEGDHLGYPGRVLQRQLFSIILPSLAGSKLFPYLLPIIALHLLNGVLLYYFFFSLFAPRIGSARARFGGLAAGLIFSISDIAATLLGFPCAVSHAMVTFFALVMLVFTNRYLRQGGGHNWLMVLVSFQLALLSNAFALGMPLFLLLLEGCASSRRLRRITLTGCASLVARYGALCLLAANYMLQFPQASDKLASSNALRDSSVMTVGWQYLAVLSDSLLVMFNRSYRFRSYDHGYLMLLGAILLAVSALALVRLLRGRGQVGLSSVLFLFMVSWCTMSFPAIFLLHAVTGSSEPLISRSYHHLYFSSVGTSLVIGYLLAWRPPMKATGHCRQELVMGLGLLSVVVLTIWVSVSVKRPFHLAKRLLLELPAHVVEDACGDDAKNRPQRRADLPRDHPEYSPLPGIAPPEVCFVMEGDSGPEGNWKGCSHRIQTFMLPEVRQRSPIEPIWLQPTIPPHQQE